MVRFKKPKVKCVEINPDGKRRYNFVDIYPQHAAQQENVAPESGVVTETPSVADIQKPSTRYREEQDRDRDAWQELEPFILQTYLEYEHFHMYYYSN